MKSIIQGLRKGIGALTLFPVIPRHDPSPADAWESVGRAFQAVGDNLRKAMYEQQENQQQPVQP